MADKPLPRPRQVTFSGWTIIVGSVMTILYAFQRVAALGSLEAQEAAAEFLATPPGDGLGLGVDDVQTVVRIMCLVAGGTAAATAILGWQALQASRSARLTLSFLAPVLFVAGLTSGGLFSALVAAATLMLWVQPARDYFDGKAPVRDRAGAKAMAGGTPYPPATERPVEPATAAQRPEEAAGSGATMTATSGHDHPYGAPQPPPPPGAPSQRPGRVTAAVITTIVASAIAFAGLGVSLIFILTSRADFVAQIDEQLAGNAAYEDFSSDTMATIAIGFLAVLVVWCVVAIVLAVATMRGSNGARIALIVSASLSALVSLLGALVIVPLLLTVASVAVIVLLATGPSSAWFAARKRAA